MSSFGFIATVSTLIVVILLARALYVVRREAAQGPMRGSEPGEGYHTINAEYSSGLGGHHTTYEIPRDPQEYNRLFVPKGTERTEK
ncbi:hypothetical protein [Falsiphaeobacter marinintestinus]|uniref:hypothetical protein n=1 Tax=Falsiphaeobacter marinintestinus TaxID=1492905 RepID=UPI0011B4EF5F|nr:hypothetical protein [Phaeobacter marinintestinus]